MAGRMSPHLHTVQNLKIVKVDVDNGLVLVKGMKHTVIFFRLLISS
jgi:ribosomal protein L3